ncbi:MAG: hypothetical protein M1820_003738 [Bogoriella megaspora]|nr:MAG: hypothetical protein M1820_003738 [Bogoriella megaspora]
MGLADAYPMPDVLPPNNNSGNALVDLTWVLFGLSTLLMAARLYSKLFKIKRFGLDDAFMLIAWISCIIFSVAIQMAYHWGVGRHYEYIHLSQGLKALKWIYVAQAFSLVGPAFGRTSFCFYLLAIIGKTKHNLKYPIWGFIVLQWIFNLTLIITLYAVCGTDMVVIADPRTTCYHQSPWSNYTYFVGAFNVVTDFFLTLAPSWMVWRLRTPFSVKLAASTLLSLSVVAMAAAIWRNCEIDILFSRDIDFTYDVSNYFEAAALETNIVIITASIPILGPIFKKKRRTKSSQTDSSRRMSDDSGDMAYNISQALGMRVPKLGNSVVITAGPLARLGSEEELPLSPLNARIKTTRQTDVRVEYLQRNESREEEKIENLPPVKNIAQI